MKKVILITWIICQSCFIKTQAQDLDSLYLLAVENNPQLKSLHLNYEAKLLEQEKVQLSNPQLGVGIPILRPETRLGGQVLNVSYSQMFPWFGTLKAEEDIFIAMAKSEFEKISANRLELFYQVEFAYYQLILIEKKRNTYAQNLMVFNSLEEVALAKVESGKTIIADVLQIQTKKIEIEHAIALLANEQKIHLAKLQEVTNRDSLLIELQLDIDTIASIEYNEDVYKDLIEDFNPLYRQLEKQIEVSEQVQKANLKNGLPSIGLGLNYNLVTERTDAFPQNNGQDILVPSIMVSVPIYRKKYKAINNEEELRQKQLNYDKEHLLNKIMNLIITYKANYDNAVLSIQFINEQIELTRSTQQVLLAAYSSSGNNFDELLKIQNQLILYQLEIEKAILQTYIERAKIDKLTNIKKHY